MKNSDLVIEKVKEFKIRTWFGYEVYSGWAFRCGDGYIGFKSDGKAPYMPRGGKKALQAILAGGGFNSFEGMCIVHSDP